MLELDEQEMVSKKVTCPECHKTTDFDAIDARLREVGQQSLRSTTDGPDSSYAGYGGWLAFFCIISIVVAPILALITSALSIAFVLEYAKHYTSLLVLTFLQTSGNLVLAGFGVYTGIKLRATRLGAVRTAKTYLLVALGWSLLSVAMLSDAEMPSILSNDRPAQIVKQLLVSIIAFVIWFSYFTVSKRVNATFAPRKRLEEQPPEFCYFCGAENPNKAKSCPSCGKRFDQS